MLMCLLLLQERLGAGVKRVLGQNRRLAEELQLHVQVRQRGLWGKEEGGGEEVCRVRGGSGVGDSDMTPTGSLQWAHFCNDGGLVGPRTATATPREAHSGTACDATLMKL
jgi:hypothetical protein